MAESKTRQFGERPIPDSHNTYRGNEFGAAVGKPRSELPREILI
jgi:hypothetical protein